MADLDLGFLALHGLAIRKAAGPPAVADLLGAEVEDVAQALRRAVEAKWAAAGGGMFMVTAAGQEWLRGQYPLRFREIRQNGALDAAYQRFERINGELLTLFTDWQAVPAGTKRVPNDHSNRAYDDKIVDRLGALHERAERVVGRCAEAQPRLTRYLERLITAHDRVLAGEHAYVSGVKIDSYHTVWYELHEDLLRMLGRTRQE